MKNRTVVWLVLLTAVVLFGYMVVSQLEGLQASLANLVYANPLVLGAAGGFWLLSVGCAAGIYLVLVGRRLRASRTFAVQIACAFAGKLLPAGLGSMGLNARYLRKEGLSLGAAAGVVGANSLVGFAAHMSLLFAVVASGHAVLPRWELDLPAGVAWFVGAGGVALLAVALYFKHIRRKVAKLLGDMSRHVLRYRKQPGRLAITFLLALGITSSYIMMLYFSAAALGYSLSFATACIVCTVGVAAGTATPTPGGLAGVEAGMVGSLMAYGLPAAEALAITLVFRMVSYWAPLVPGGIAFVLLRKRYMS